MSTRAISLGILSMVCWAGVIRAADISFKLADDQPPKDVGEAIKKTLQSKAIEVTDGTKPLFRFWFCSQVPLKNAPESADKGLSALSEVTLVGVASVGEGRRDYKDNEIPPGTYTMRFGLQPQDGDHLGTSEFPFFLVLIPAKTDLAPDSITKYKAMVKASGKASSTGHPLVLALRPPSGDVSDKPALTTPAPDHKAVQLSIPAQVQDGGAAAKLNFQLVFQGKYKS